MKRIHKSETTEKKSLVTILHYLNKEGYKTKFKSTVIGLLSLSSMNLFKSNDIKNVHLYRFDVDSNPSDSSIVYAIETKEGEKGTLLFEYGTSGNAMITKFMSGVVNLIK